ncbi:reverse transcriptase domain-containing protein [Pontixanthobacter gangjinensis]|uniref:Reverse transcriptase domain-containing protein n=1 Tax=Pontixanthobacter gangjinensis TaxID=1028742 RepID=A0A6I4SHU1_9SPHN|nr:reverse transcriptase domain-containing protein [Pontixanthobacter gangjinensis]MXO55291.1 hypothetical protein [Pontixanthobacter gangjinensis]
MASLSGQRRYKRELLARVASHSQGRGSSVTDPLLQCEIRRYLLSHAVQSATLHYNWAKKLNEIEASKLWAQRQRSPIVPSDFRRIQPVQISWRPKKRSTSGHRKICSLPSSLKMFHSLANDLIRAQHQPRAHIGDWKGRGRDYQVKTIASAITATSQWVVVADVNRAFQNVNANALYQLPYLPEALTRRAIDHRSHRFDQWSGSNPAWDTSSPLHDELKVAPSGILEGSPASNAIFSVLLDDLPDHLDETIKCFVYCDNIILIASSEAHAREGANALVRYFADHRAGPFEVTSNCRPVWAGFDHLGYLISHQWNGETIINLPHRSWEKLHKRLSNPDQSEDDVKRWFRASFGAITNDLRSGWECLIDDNISRERKC